mgnify:CR=1 FL=1
MAVQGFDTPVGMANLLQTMLPANKREMTGMFS